jgi:small subunit ribosomal protein S7
MPRRREIEKRVPPADPVYNSVLVSQFINAMMWDGKKRMSERIFYKTMERLRERANDDPLKIFKKAVENCKPTVEVKSRRVGGANYQVPIEVEARRRTSLALRWLISFARARSENGMAEKLCNEFLDASAGRGTTIKRKDDIHRMAEANKAFAHYRW